MSSDLYPIEPAVRVPQPRRRLWRTRFKRPRPLERFSPIITGAAQQQADEEELSRYGRVLLLEDLLVVQHRDGTISSRTHVVAQLYGPQHLAEWDDQTWAYDPRSHRIRVVHARATAGGVTADAQQFVVPYMHAPGRVDAYAKVVRLKFPGLVPGSIVDFLMQQDFFTNDDQIAAMWREFYIRTPEPTRRRRMTFAIAAPFEPRFELHHSDADPEESQVGEYRVWTWDLRDLDAMPVDAWTPPARDYVPWIDASTLPTWQPVIDQFERELLPPPNDHSVRDLFAEITADAEDARGRVACIYEYATRELRYGRHPDDLLDRNRRNAEAVVRELRGDCKDKSALMVALLREMDVDAQVAVLLTADAGLRPYLPSLRFNHAIVHARLDGEDLWMDPASDTFSFGTRPRLNDGVPALLLGGEAPEMGRVPPSDPEHHGSRRICRGRLEDDGSYTFRAEATLPGELGANLRRLLQGALPREREQVVSLWVLDALSGGEVSDVTTSELDDLKVPLQVAYTVRLERFARQVKDIWLFRVPWDGPMVSTGPTTAASRDMHLAAPPPVLLTDEHHVELPAGFAGYGLPLHIQREAFGSEYAIEAGCEDGAVRCVRRVMHRGGIIAPEDFAEFRAYWNGCSRDDATDLVFVRGSI